MPIMAFWLIHGGSRYLGFFVVAKKEAIMLLEINDIHKKFGSGDCVVQVI